MQDAAKILAPVDMLLGRMRKRSARDIFNVVDKLDRHDHLALIYSNMEEQFLSVAPYMRKGLERGEKCIYIADDNTVADVVDALSVGGIDVKAALKSGALTILTKQDTYFKKGYFEPESMMQLIKDVAAAAKAEGYAVVRATGEMTWALGGGSGVERLIEYEAKLNYCVSEIDMIVLCQYNRSRFSPEIILDAIRTHPLVMCGGFVCRNFYYVPPDEFLSPYQSIREVDRLLNHIVERERLDEANKRSAESIEDLYNNAPCGYHSLDKDGRFIRINDTELKWLGYEREDVIGKMKVTDIMTVDSLNAFRVNYPHFLEQGYINDLEFDWIRKDGTIIHVLLSGNMVKDEAGNFVMTRTMAYDITELTKIKDELRLAGEIIANLAEGVFLIRSSDGVIVYANPRFERMFGYGPFELTGKFVSVVNAPSCKTPEETAEEINDALRKDKVWSGEVRNIKKDGTHFWCSVSVSTFNHPIHGEVWVAVHTDITERKKADDELKRLNLELQDSLANVKQLSGLLPICSSCKKIRNDGGYWSNIEKFISEHSEAEFSHGYCPDCEWAFSVDLKK